MSLIEKIKKVRRSIVAIGFKPEPGKVKTGGSGFCVSQDGKILTAAHLYKTLNKEEIKKLEANVMVEEKEEKEFERYRWQPIKLVKKDDTADLAVFQLEGSEKTLLTKLDLGDSDKVDVGQEVYFIGFPYATRLMAQGWGITLITNKGIISNIKRVSPKIDQSCKRIFFMVDAISNPGASGSPLLDLETNKVIGVMTTAFRTKSRVMEKLDIREPMHIAGARPINLAKALLK